MRLPSYIRILFFFLAAFAGCLNNALGQDRFPEKLNPPRLVSDYANLLSKSQNAQLEQKLLRYSDTTSTEIALVIIRSLQGEDPNLYAAELGEKWGVGRKGKDNGLVFLIAVDDRKLAIQNGYGLEDKLTDLETKLIIEEYIVPEFKKGDYYTGINKGVDQIFKLLNGSFEGSPNRRDEGDGWRFVPFLLILIIFIVLISRNKGGGRGGYRGGGGYWIGGFGSGGFGGGSSGFGGGSGGFGGFGGGSFGGGGASGSW